MKKKYICPQIVAVRMCAVSSFAASPNSNTGLSPMNYKDAESATSGMVMEAKSRDEESDWSALDPMFDW